MKVHREEINSRAWQSQRWGKRGNAFIQYTAQIELGRWTDGLMVARARLMRVTDYQNEISPFLFNIVYILSSDTVISGLTNSIGKKPSFVW